MNIHRTWSVGVCALATLCTPVLAQGEAIGLDREVISAHDGSEITLEIGRLDVPEVRANAQNTISLAFIRVRSEAPDPGPPVFFIAGGPGGSSIDAVRAMARNGGRRFLDLTGGDVIGIDQRGVGLSRPNLESSTPFGFDPATPGDRAEMLGTILRVCREEAARWRERGVDLNGYNTVESADDIDAVRRAMGYDKITLWGGSYGSHLAMAYIRRHAEHVERALLTGPEGPDHTIKLPANAQDAIERLSKLVRADERLGQRIPNLTRMIRDVLDRLDDAPAFAQVDGVRVGVSRFDVQRLLAMDLSTIRGSGDGVPAMVWKMAQGDFSGVARRLLEDRRSASVGSAMQMAMDSASGLSAERAATIREQAGVCLLGDTLDFPFPDVAQAWGVGDLGDVYRSPLETDIPVLFIVGDLDSRTPVGNARELMRTMPNAHLIVVKNVGHNDVPMGHPDLLPAWRDFLAGRTVRTRRVETPPISFTPLDD